jgi:hypothetical protein
MAAPTDDVDAAVDALYALDLDEFTAARDRLVRELRGAGDRDAAATVKALRKPSRVAWAVNQAVRREPDALDAVLEAGQHLRDVQQEALASARADGLHDAVRARQQAVRALTDVAVGLLGATGESARDEIEQTLNAASIDPASANAVREARLTRELEPPDIFETLDAPAVFTPRVSRTKTARAPRKTAEPAAPEPAAEEPVVDPALRREADEATAAADAARADADAAERAHRDAKAHADDLAERARDAARAADEARGAARTAAAATKDARRRAEEAERAARRARAAIERR